MVGSPRSGTTLLYHMLLSAGGFTRYRAETHIFNSLAPRFGQLRRPADVHDALDVWLASDCHTLSGLSADAVRSATDGQVHNAGDFLRIVMALMTAQQGAQRWAETTPAHVLHMQEIRAQIPGALFIHVIRDGRDVAASLEKQGWIRPLAMDRDRPVLAAAVYWDWIVRQGRAEGARVGACYREVRYEALVDAPEETMRELETFLEHRLDWEAITRVGIGSVGRPNTSFPGAADGFRDRWRTQLSAQDAHDVDALLAPTLRLLGYQTEAASRGAAIAARTRLYDAWFSLRDWLKRDTPMGRRNTDLSHFRAGSMKITAEKLEGIGGASPMA
ncbi:MAG: sulfotransferase [Gemmatimonadota bacterium]